MRGLKTASEIHKLALDMGLSKQLLLINKAGRALPISESGYELARANAISSALKVARGAGV